MSIKSLLAGAGTSALTGQSGVTTSDNKQSWRHSLRTKLVVLLFVFGLVPASMLLTVVLLQTDEVQESLSAAQGTTAKFTMVGIDRFLSERYGDVQAFTLNGKAAAAASAADGHSAGLLTKDMNAYVAAYGVYPLMMVVDSAGQAVAVNSLNAAGKPVDSRGLLGRDFSNAAWFKNVLAGKFLAGRNGLTGTAVQPAARYDIVAEITGGDGFAVPFSASISDADGAISGVWVNFLDFRAIEGIIADSYGKVAKSGMASAEFTLLNPSGTVLVDFDPQANGYKDLSGYSRDFDVIGSLNLAKAGVEAAQQAIKGEDGTMVAHHARKDIDQAAGYSHSEGAEAFPGLGWSMLVRVPVSEAFALWNNLLVVLEVLVVAALVIIMVAGVFIGSRAVKPLLGMSEAMRRLAGGDKETEVPARGRKDEIGTIAAAVQVFKDSMIEKERLEAEQKEAERKAAEAEREAEERRKQAEEEEQRKEEQRAERRRQEMLELADSFEQNVGGVIQTVMSSAEQLKASAQGLSATAEQTSQQSTAVSAASDQASGSVQTVASSAEELSASIQEISRQVQASADKAKGAVDRTDRTNTQIQGLADAAQRIGDVITLINDIAAQTNLLALNATIEAARAGEAGKGFAVVASEVKNLASQTAKATEEISQQIQSVQAETSSAVSAIGDVGNVIGEINDIASSIAAAVEEQGMATKEITSSAQQAAQGTQEVNSNIAGVSSAAAQTGSASTQLLQSATSLGEQSEKLQSAVGAFLERVRAA